MADPTNASTNDTATTNNANPAIPQDTHQPLPTSERGQPREVGQAHQPAQSPPTSQDVALPSQSAESPAGTRICWICFTEEVEESADSSTTLTRPHPNRHHHTDREVHTIDHDHDQLQRRRWVRPCRCRGDTRWSHESCLLTFIIRRQTEKMQDGVLMGLQVLEEQSPPPNQQLLWAGLPTEPVLRDTESPTSHTVPGWVVPPAHESLMAGLRGDEWISCPQCKTPYQIVMRQRPLVTRWFMRACKWVSAGTSRLCPVVPSESCPCITGSMVGAVVREYVVPVVTVAAAGYGVVICSISFGAYAVTTMLGPADPISVLIQTQPWSLSTWMLLFHVPGLLLVTQVPSLRRPLGWTGVCLGALSLAQGTQLVVGAGGRVSILAGHAGLDPMVWRSCVCVEELARWSVRDSMRFHSTQLMMWFAARSLYHHVHVHLVAPWIVGSRRRFRDADGQPTSIDQLGSDATVSNFIDYGLLPDPGVDSTSVTGTGTPQDTIHISVMSIMGGIVNAFLIPAYSAVAGHVLKRGLMGVLTWGSASRVAWVAHKSLRMRDHVSRWDTFLLCLVGGSGLAVMKDLMVLLYNRQRRLQRLNMHVMDYGDHRRLRM